MNRSLATSACFSLGIHLLVLLPLGIFPLAGGGMLDAGVDVVRGMSSVELELVSAEAATRESVQSEEQPGETGNPVSPKLAPAQQSYLDEGVTADWSASGVKNNPPRYPRVARAQGWEGTVIVRARVGQEGRVTEIAVRKGSGHAILDQVAVESIRGWVFQPARSGGKDRSSWVEIPVSFRLQTHPRETKGEAS